MKRLLLALAAVLLIAPISPMGCAKATAPMPPLAPGYQNTADQTMGQTLAAAHAFYQKLQQDSLAGTITLSSQEKTALNDLQVAINIAQTAYLAFHAGTGTQAAAQSAVDSVQAKQATVKGLMPGGF